MRRPTKPNACRMLAEDYEAETVRRLEDTILDLWAEMPVANVKELRDECPAMVEFIAHLHHSVEHEQAMVRRSVWSQPTRENEHG